MIKRISDVPKTAHGFTLIELMVALAVGIILIAGVSRIYSSSASTNTEQSLLIDVQNNGRFALQILRRGLINTGGPYSEYVGRDYLPFGAQKNPVLASNHKALEGMQNEANIIGHPVAVRYKADTGLATEDMKKEALLLSLSSARNCRGTTITPQTMAEADSTVEIVNHFYVNGEGGGSNQQYRLMCRTTNAAGEYSPDDNRAVALVDGVEYMRVLYGVDTNEDNYANYYATSNQIKDNEWSKVVALKVGILVSSTKEREIADIDQRKKYWVLGSDVSAKRPYLRAYGVFTMTVPLRNMMRVR